MHILVPSNLDREDIDIKQPLMSESIIPLMQGKFV